MSSSVAVRAVRIEQEGHRAPLISGVRTGAFVRGSHPPGGRNASSARLVPNFFRKPFGAWRLAWHAGSKSDFITAQGIGDAWDAGSRQRSGRMVSGAREFEVAMAYSPRVTGTLPTYEFTCQFAMLAPRRQKCSNCSKAVHGNPDAMNGFVRVISGVVSPAEFSPRRTSDAFSPRPDEDKSRFLECQGTALPPAQKRRSSRRQSVHAGSRSSRR